MEGARERIVFYAHDAALARLEEAARKRIAIVAAPPGTGKSALLRDFAAREGAALIDLAGAKATFREATRQFCDALGDAAPGARLAFASAYTRAGERGRRPTAMARWLASYLRETPRTIVVDTVDRLGAETAAFAEFAEALVQHAPGVRLVLAAREHGELPIPRWFAADLTAMPIGADELGRPPLRDVTRADVTEPSAAVATETAVDELVASGRIREALELACAAALTARTAELLRAHGLDLDDRGEGDAVDVALDALPDDVDDAPILLLRAMRETRLARLDTSESWYRHAIDRAGSRAQAAQAAYRLGSELVRRERADAVELLEPYANDDGLGAAERCAIGSVLAEAYWMAGRRDDALAAARATLARADELDVDARAHLYARASYVEFYAGARDAAREHAAIAAQLAESASLYVVAFAAHSVLYNIGYEDAGPSEALAHLAHLAECAIRSGNVDFQLYALVASYEMHVERGDAAAIERLERDFAEFDLHYGASSAMQGLLPSRALMRAWSGAFAVAHELLASTGAQQDDADRDALRWAEIAVYAAAAGLRAEAHAALDAFAGAYDADGGASYHSARAAVLAELAAGLAGRPAPRAPNAIAGRLETLRAAARIALAVRAGTQPPRALLDALDALRARELGGYAKLLAALPVSA